MSKLLFQSVKVQPTSSGISAQVSLAVLRFHHMDISLNTRSSRAVLDGLCNTPSVC